MYYFRGILRRQKKKNLNAYKWKISSRPAGKYTGTEWQRKKKTRPDLINIES